jgi:hypothetical protein
MPALRAVSGEGGQRNDLPVAAVSLRGGPGTVTMVTIETSYLISGPLGREEEKRSLA